jgi:hypothetical protein
MDKFMHNGDSAHGDDLASHDADRTLTEIVKEQPMVCLAIAGAAGFVLGGGMRRAGGTTVLALLGQIAVREVFGDLIAESLESRHEA